MRFFRLPIFLIVLFTASGLFNPPRAHAVLCAVEAGIAEASEWAKTIVAIQMALTTEVTATKVWITQVFWEDNVLPAMMLMAEQLTAVSMKQTQIIGTFLDAKHQLETQQVFQRLAARAHKDYHPSTGMCEFGSGAKSLAASERKGEYNALLMSQRSQDRNLGASNTAAAAGEGGDKESRLKQFREKFCDPDDNNSGLAYMCEHDQDGNLGNSTIGSASPRGVGAATAKASRKNKDIDYVRTLDFPWTLKVDFTDATLTDDEEEVVALASNLYGHEIFFRPPSPSLKTPPNTLITGMQRNYMDARALLAKRSVAENTFNAITAMKSEGTPGSRDYLFALMKELTSPPAGATAQQKQQQTDDINKMLGPNPSYYAQMEVLTKKIFQNPDFFTNLYDTPANVERKGVAIQAIGLMQKFDTYKSYLRNEASLSVLLELAVQELQNEIENEINDITNKGLPATTKKATP
jgi:hypothetical protein